MTVQIRRAERKKAKLRLALIGPTGSGKTLSALMMAQGLGGKIGMIDTENGSGDLYANRLTYDIITLEAPYTVQKYRDAIHAFEDARYDILIIDSLSHAWAGAGGLLDRQGQLEASGRFKNSFATWREITPEHNRLVEDIMASKCHVIVTMRVKTEYVLEKDDKGKVVPRKIGLSPVQRDGVEYEFTVVMDIAENHVALASKDRTDLFDGWADKITPATGTRLLQWLDAGTEDKAHPTIAPVSKFTAAVSHARAQRALSYFVERFDLQESLILSALGIDSVSQITDFDLKKLSEIKKALANGADVTDFFPNNRKTMPPNPYETGAPPPAPQAAPGDHGSWLPENAAE